MLLLITVEISERFIMFGPIIKLQEIKLRPIEKSDLTFYVEGFKNPNVIRFLLLPKAPTIKEEIQWWNKTKKSEETINWAIEYNSQCIGSIALNDYNQFLRTAEIGYQIHNPKFWGLGIATRVAREVIDYGFEKLKLETISVGIIVDNKYSAQIVKKFGFKKIGVFPHKLFRNNKWHSEVLYVLLKDDWEKNRQKRDFSN